MYEVLLRCVRVFVNTGGGGGGIQSKVLVELAEKVCVVAALKISLGEVGDTT